MILDGEAQRVAEGEGAGRVNDQRIAMRRTAECRSARVDDAGDGQSLPGVEHYGIEAGTERQERGRHAAVERRRVPIEVPDLDPLMHEVVVVRSGVRIVGHPLRVRLGSGGGGGEEEQSGEE